MERIKGGQIKAGDKIAWRTRNNVVVYAEITAIVDEIEIGVHGYTMMHGKFFNSSCCWVEMKNRGYKMPNDWDILLLERP